MKLLSSMAPRAMLAAATSEYCAAHDTTIELDAAGGVDVARRIEAGEAVDIVVLAADAIDKLVKQGHLSHARDLVLSGIAVGVPQATPLPDLSDEAAVKRAVLAAETVSYSTGPSGRYLESLFARWGILEEIRARIVVPRPGVPVASLIGAGQVALGFQQLSEMLDVQSVRIAGPLPSAVQQFTTFTGGVSTASLETDAADRFLRYLAAPEREGLKQRFGMAGA